MKFLLLLAIAAVSAASLAMLRASVARGPDVLSVYCAAGQAEPITAIAERYRQQFGVDVRLQFGGTGTLISQISVARRGDLLIAADRQSMRQMEERELVTEVVDFARHYPVVALRTSDTTVIRTLQDLSGGKLRVAIGNPEATSIGKATRTALGDRWDTFRKSVTTMKPTVTEIAMDVRLGAVDAAVVWNSTVPQFEGLRGVRLPELDPHGEMVSAGILAGAERPVEAGRFARYLTASQANRQLLAQFDLQVISGEGPSDPKQNPSR